MGPTVVNLDSHLCLVTYELRPATMPDHSLVYSTGGQLYCNPNTASDVREAFQSWSGARMPCRLHNDPGLNAGERLNSSRLENDNHEQA